MQALAAILVLSVLAASFAHAADPLIACNGEPIPAGTPAGNGNPRTPPNADGPTAIRAGFFIKDLKDIDAVQSSFWFRGVLTFRWCDPRLAFDPATADTDERSFFGAEVLAEPIWRGRGFLVNLVGDAEETARVLRIRYDGTASGSANMSARLASNFDLRRFPFDTQRLILEIESYVWDEGQVRIMADEEKTGFAETFEIPEWTVTDVQANVRTVDVVRADKPFSRLTLAIDIKRKSGFYLWKILLPLLIIVMLSWSVFWMVDEYFGMRVRLAATGVLTVVAYQFAVAKDLPRVGYLTLIDKVTVISFLLLATTVLESYLASSARAKDPEKALRIDRAARWMFPLGYAALILVVFIGSTG